MTTFLLLSYGFLNKYILICAKQSLNIGNTTSGTSEVIAASIIQPVQEEMQVLLSRLSEEVWLDCFQGAYFIIACLSWEGSWVCYLFLFSIVQSVPRHSLTFSLSSSYTIKLFPQKINQQMLAFTRWDRNMIHFERNKLVYWSYTFFLFKFVPYFCSIVYRSQTRNPHWKKFSLHISLTLILDFFNNFAFNLIVTYCDLLRVFHTLNGSKILHLQAYLFIQMLSNKLCYFGPLFKIKKKYMFKCLLWQTK